MNVFLYLWYDAIALFHLHLIFKILCLFSCGRAQSIIFNISVFDWGLQCKVTIKYKLLTTKVGLVFQTFETMCLIYFNEFLTHLYILIKVNI